MSDELKPCPFCRSTNLRESEDMYCDDEGEHPGVECLDCDALARADRWNQRPVCEWTVSRHGFIDGACGYEGFAGSRIIARCNYCPNCGGKVEVKNG